MGTNLSVVKQGHHTSRDTPSERLLFDVLQQSRSGDVMVSDVIVIWTDEDGRQHMRSAANE